MRVVTLLVFFFFVCVSAAAQAPPVEPANSLEEVRDKRNVLVKRTVEGALFVERLGDVVIAKAQELTI